MNPFSVFFLQTDSEQNFKQINRLLSFKEETTTQQINVRPTDQLDVKLTIFKILMLNNYNQQLYCPKKTQNDGNMKKSNNIPQKTNTY